MSKEKANAEQPSSYTCPGCGSLWSEQDLLQTRYRCRKCGLELVHTARTNGGTAEPLSWLHQPGDIVLDRYCIEKLLGKGGFAATYLVKDLRLNGRRRALKEIPESRYDQTEMEVLSRLRHPTIPDIIDRVDQGGMVCLVLELGGGRTLEDERHSRGGRIPFTMLRPWLLQLGDVLGYLHGQNPPIIHRDLKPDNILLDDQDRIMLIDFGIAKQATASGQTRTLARAATHGFSPPEQALGTGTDPRSDVYALAATAYCLLTGRVPTPAHDRVAGQELTPPSQLTQGLAPLVDDAIMQALNLNINLRPATVAQFLRPMAAPLGTFPTVRVEDLTRHSTDPGTNLDIGPLQTTTTSPPGPARWKPWVAGASIVVLAAGGALFLVSRPDPPQTITTAPVTIPQSDDKPTKAVSSMPAAPEVVQPEVEQPTATPELKGHNPGPANPSAGGALQQLSIKRRLPPSREATWKSPEEKYKFLDSTPPSAMQPSQRRVPVSPMAPKKSIPDSGFR